MKLPAPITLSSGLVAEIEEDRWVPGAITLTVNGTPQSHVNLRDPSDLFFEYVRRIGHVIDLFRPRGDAISALHLGAGAFTLPRYVAATRPGSRQQVVELEGALVDFVREVAPLPKRASIRVRYGDAREVVTRLPHGMHGAMDLIVVDVFAGSRTPAHVSSTEFFELLRPLLTPDGLVAVNVTDGPGRDFAQKQAATLGAVFGTVAAMSEPQVLKHRRYGNVVLVAALADDSNAPGASGAVSPTFEWLPRALAGGPHPARMLIGRELEQWIAGAQPVTDADALQSPEPPSELFGRG